MTEIIGDSRGESKAVFTLRQIAEMTNSKLDTIKKRAARESWRSCGMMIVNHNETRLYALQDLPEDIRERIGRIGQVGPIDDNATASSEAGRQGPQSSPSSGLITRKDNCPAPAPEQERGFLPVKKTEAVGQIVSMRPEAATDLRDWQRDVMTARLAIIGAVEGIAGAENLTINRAIERFLELHAAGMIDAAISDMAETANHRKGNDRSLTKGTIYRWIRDRNSGGNLALAPAGGEEFDERGNLIIPGWAREFMALYRLPAKPTVPETLEMMARRGGAAPSYSQATRFLKRFSRLDLQRGRMSGSELRSIRGYTRRSKDNLLPLDVVVADGHSFKAKVAHPAHGRPFHPEVEGIIDAATRVCVGWSAGLAESSHVVADALRHAVTVNEKKPMGGAMALVYADQGAGNTAKAISHVELGIIARIGATFKTGIPGNPQGRGIIEKLQASLWIRAAKELPTYTGKSMDQLAQRRIAKIMNRDIKLTGASPALTSWRRFLEFAQQQVDAYNNRPHSALPKITDPNTGLRRHLTPAERWRMFVAEGWQPTLLSEDELKDLFRPYLQVACRRAQVTVFGNIYYHKALEHYHGEDVIAHYDIHDAHTIQVRDLAQRLICEAVWDANKRDFFPISALEQARQKRMEGRLKRLEEKAWEVRQERKEVIETSAEDGGARRLETPPRERDLIMTEYDIDDIAL